uniref:Uncharacterized protein n=1 Tax=Taeniopygia guttata TaxID=59729 RepID=A0A674GXK2_TAEGU
MMPFPPCLQTFLLSCSLVMNSSLSRAPPQTRICLVSNTWLLKAFPD